jgi:hypothetical protein
MRNVINQMVPVVLGALLCLFLLGCNVVRVSFNASLGPEDVTFIVPGKTTLSEVVAKLGAPDSLIDSDTGVVATYRFFDLKYSRVNFGWLAKPWTPVDPDLIFSRTGLGVDAFQILCNSQWVVLHQEFQRHLIRPANYPYPFQQSGLSAPHELLRGTGPVRPAIMANHESGNHRSRFVPDQ